MTPIATWFVALLILCVLLPYLLGVRPRRPRDWRHVLIAIAFLMWLLLGFGYRYSRQASAIVMAPPHGSLLNRRPAWPVRPRTVCQLEGHQDLALYPREGCPAGATRGRGEAEALRMRTCALPHGVGHFAVRG